MNEKKKLLDEYLEEHNKKISRNIINISGVYLFVSIIWNLLFTLFHLDYSRANIYLLFIGLLLWIGVELSFRLLNFSYKLKRHIVFVYVLTLLTFLYFGSGYHESWSFYLLLPLLAGLYGDKNFLMLYSSFGAAFLLVNSIYFPINIQTIDEIDISNRILVFIIVSTISVLTLRQFFGFYLKQVDYIVESSEKTLEQIVDSFIVAIEAKDTYTFGHSERVSKYAVELAKMVPEFNSHASLKRIKLMGLIHDIGKIHIPEYVLSKPSSLTTNEYEIIKSHTTHGAKMLEKIEGLAPLKDAVLYHHERWDGKGYPTGKSGENIPLEARILAIADSFDAMTSTRAYRDAMPLKEAFSRLEQSKGTQFDPNLIELLQEIKISWMKIHKSSQNDLDEFEKITDLL